MERCCDVWKADRVLIGDAAVEADVPLHVMVSWMHRSGSVLVVPGSEDPRCWLVSGFEAHEPDCGCEFLPAHPCISQLNEQ